MHTVAMDCIAVAKIAIKRSVGFPSYGNVVLPKMTGNATVPLPIASVAG